MPAVRLWQLALIPACALALLEACARKESVESGGSHGDASIAFAQLDADTAAVTAKAASPKLVLKIAAASFVATVSDQPQWPESDAGARRVGYLRNGSIVSAYDPPTKTDDCKEGWYELTEGGYVCGKVATIDLQNPRVKHSPKQPDRDAGMPYRYGINVSDGTPLYRRVLSAEDRRQYEPHLAAKTEDSSKSDEKDEEPPLAGNSEEEAPAPSKHVRAKHGHNNKDHDHKSERPKDPFLIAGSRDAGRPQLRELKGRGVLVRKMARGFIVALDRDFKAAGTRWWRTTFGFAAPFDRIALQQGPVTKHVGSWFTGEGAVADLLPFVIADAGTTLADLDSGASIISTDAGAPLAGTVAFVTSGVNKLQLTDDGKGGLKVGYGSELPRRSAVLLTGREATVSGVTYQQTSGGFWVRLPELKIAKPQIPSDIGADERWIDVDLTRQQLVAFEGRRPVFATLISSGRRNQQDPEHDFPTPPGTFRIREKHVTTTMDGDVASDGPYSIEDVPWVMYFQGSYALHGAFWHDAFGNMRSHGCVNLAPEDARALFAWADPQLPAGWHGVFSKDENSGSRVVIHEDPPPGRRRHTAPAP